MIYLSTNSFFMSFKSYIGEIKVYSGEKLNRNDVVIFPGGEDISPSIYNGKKELSYGVNERRDKVEKEVFKVAMESGARLIGVCRGHQLILAMLGASLVQDLYHPDPHYIKVLTEEFFKYFESPVVNSLHHQGVSVENAEKVINVVAEYKGISEMCVDNSERIITVQFHPEFMMNENSLKFFEIVKRMGGVK